MPEDSGSGTGATGTSRNTSEVADKLKEILARLESADNDIGGDKGSIEISLREADAMWQVAYNTSI